MLEECKEELVYFAGLVNGNALNDIAGLDSELHVLHEVFRAITREREEDELYQHALADLCVESATQHFNCLVQSIKQQ
jgi:hypothetical protein